MATYFSNSETKRNMTMYMNNASSSGGSFSYTFAGNLQLPYSNESQLGILSNPGGSQIGLHGFNSWEHNTNDMTLMQPTGDATGVVLQQGQGLSLSLGTHVTPHLGISSYLGPNVPFNSNHDAKAELWTPSYRISSNARDQIIVLC